MNQKKFGTKIELEHKKTFGFIKNYIKKTGKMPSNTQIAGKIAKDHLKEDPKYYYKVKKYKL